MGKGRGAKKIRKLKEEKVRRKNIQVHEKVGKSQDEAGSLKQQVRSQLARCEMKSCTPLWRESHAEVKSLKKLTGSQDVEKVRACVARSTFGSQSVEDTTRSEHFWAFRYHFVWQAQGIVHLVKNEQRGHFQRIWYQGFRVAGAL